MHFVLLYYMNLTIYQDRFILTARHCVSWDHNGVVVDGRRVQVWKITFKRNSRSYVTLHLCSGLARQSRARGSGRVQHPRQEDYHQARLPAASVRQVRPELSVSSASECQFIVAACGVRTGRPGVTPPSLMTSRCWSCSPPPPPRPGCAPSPCPAPRCPPAPRPGSGAGDWTDSSQRGHSTSVNSEASGNNEDDICPFIAPMSVQKDNFRECKQQMSPGKMCVIGKDFGGPCPGDSGSPLVTYSKRTGPQLIGLVSNGAESCKVGHSLWLIHLFSPHHSLDVRRGCRGYSPGFLTTMTGSTSPRTQRGGSVTRGYIRTSSMTGPGPTIRTEIGISSPTVRTIITIIVSNIIDTNTTVTLWKTFTPTTINISLILKMHFFQQNQNSDLGQALGNFTTVNIFTDFQTCIKWSVSKTTEVSVP